MTDAEADRLTELLEKATPRPWQWNFEQPALVVAAVNALPGLLAERKQMKELLSGPLCNRAYGHESRLRAYLKWALGHIVLLQKSDCDCGRCMLCAARTALSEESK